MNQNEALDEIPTPLTDEESRTGAYHKDGDYSGTCGKQIVHIDFARSIERKLHIAKQRLLEISLSPTDFRTRELAQQALKQISHE